MQKTLNVKGMTCSHCEAAVKRALEGLEGVSKIDVDLAADKVDVTFDDAKVSEADLKQAIEDQGYDVV